MSWRWNVLSQFHQRFRELTSKRARTARRLQGTGLVSSAPDRHAHQLTTTQTQFLQWNAERLGISVQESERQYRASMAAVPGGHSGREFARFNGVVHDLFRVFSEDHAGEVFDLYRNHALMHFLVMLTYPEPQWQRTDLVVDALKERASVSILDFGCGLAQQSRSLALYLKNQGKDVTLALADVPTLRADFLVWLGKRLGISTTFLPCTRSEPIPTLPRADVCQATEFFEHVHNPIEYLERFDEVLSPGGLLITGTFDHHQDFMHVSPDLAGLRAKIAALGYRSLVPNVVFKKG